MEMLGVGLAAFGGGGGGHAGAFGLRAAKVPPLLHTSTSRARALRGLKGGQSGVVLPRWAASSMAE